MWGSPNRGAVFFLDTLPTIFEDTLQGLKGRFTKDELMIFLTFCAEENVLPEFAGKNFTTHIETFIDRKFLPEEYDIDSKRMIKELKKLTVFQALCLESWAAARTFSEVDDEVYVGRLV
jgi:hypothetical protein